MDYGIRISSPEDADHMAAIHTSCFPKGWEAAEFASLLHGGATGYMVQNEAGFLLIRIAADEADIITLAVTPSFQRQGFAGNLLKHCMHNLQQAFVKHLFLEVDEENIPAIALYKSLGFTQVGTRKDYYQGEAGERKAALVMQKTLTGH